MPTSDDSLIKRVQSSYRQLTVVATNLNAVSNQLGTVIGELDSALKRLNLGISTWVNFSESSSPDGNYYYLEQIGYDKIGGSWGVGLRTVSGYESDPDNGNTEQWLFNDAPRRLRVSSIEKIPDLLEGLIKSADATAKNISEKIEQARQLSAAINAITDKR